MLKYSSDLNIHRCRSCGIWKPLSKFNKFNLCRFYYKCRECFKRDLNTRKKSFFKACSIWRKMPNDQNRIILNFYNNNVNTKHISEIAGIDLEDLNLLIKMKLVK